MPSTDPQVRRSRRDGGRRAWRADRATFAVLSLTHNYKVIASEAPRAEMHAWIGDRGHDLDAIARKARSAVSEVELCISSFDYCKVGDVRIVMMNFQ
mgnify:CR=1 FL=1